MESKRAQAIKQMIKSAGLVCAGMEQTAGGHIAAYLQRQDGTKVPKMFFSATPGDWRGDKNKLSVLRRHAGAAS